MKATLTLANGATMTADIGEPEAMELFRSFAFLISKENSEIPVPEMSLPPPPTQAISLPEPSASEPPSAAPTRKPPDTKLVAFKCESCGRIIVARMDWGTDIGDVLTCRCGREWQIREVKRARGSCGNCGENFYHIHVANGLRELICRKCKSIIDIAEKPDGTLVDLDSLRR